MQVLWVVYFSRTGYFTPGLSPGVQAYELLHGADPGFAETAKPSDGTWEAHDYFAHEKKPLGQKSVLSGGNLKTCGQLRQKNNNNKNT